MDIINKSLLSNKKFILEDLMTKQRKNKWYHKLIIGLLSFIFLPILIFFIYASQYYHAEPAVQDVLISNEAVQVETSDRLLTFTPTDKVPTTGIIFYPGAKVEATSYAPLMKDLAAKGYFCSIVKMPFNLAFFNMNAADPIVLEHPEIKSWYLSGHSLGGAMAASYISGHTDTFDGLILLAAYSTSDLTSSDLKVLTIYGSHDQVLNLTSLEKYAGNLPASSETLILEGGNHAGFAYYGPQKGDGTATLTQAEQSKQTATAISHFMQ